MIRVKFNVHSGSTALMSIINALKTKAEKLTEGEWEISISPATRSLDQNRLYWMWLRCLADFTGETAEGLHEYCKREYLLPNTFYVFGEYVDGERSTTNLNRKDFTEYLERVKVLGAELGVMLPLPEEQGYEELIERYG